MRRSDGSGETSQPKEGSSAPPGSKTGKPAGIPYHMLRGGPLPGSLANSTQAPKASPTAPPRAGANQLSLALAAQNRALQGSKSSVEAPESIPSLLSQAPEGGSANPEEARSTSSTPFAPSGTPGPSGRRAMASSAAIPSSSVSQFPSKSPTVARSSSTSTSSVSSSSSSSSFHPGDSLTLVVDRAMLAFDRGQHARLPLASLSPADAVTIGLRPGDVAVAEVKLPIPPSLSTTSTTFNASSSRSASSVSSSSSSSSSSSLSTREGPERAHEHRICSWLCEIWPMQTVKNGNVRLQEPPPTLETRLLASLSCSCSSASSSSPSSSSSTASSSLQSPSKPTPLSVASITSTSYTTYFQQASLSTSTAGKNSSIASCVVPGASVTIRRLVTPPIVAHSVTLVRVTDESTSSPSSSTASTTASSSASSSSSAEALLRAATERHLRSQLAGTPFFLPSIVTARALRQSHTYCAVEVTVSSQTYATVAALLGDDAGKILQSIPCNYAKGSAAFSSSSLSSSSSLVTIRLPLQSTSSSTLPTSSHSTLSSLAFVVKDPSGIVIASDANAIRESVSVDKALASSLSIPPSTTATTTTTTSSSSSSSSTVHAAPRASPLSAASSDPFASIGGLSRELRLIREALEIPLLRPELYRQHGVRPPRGVLLHGPPGTGKTLIARAVADSALASFISVNGAEITGKVVGAGEKKLMEIFARAKAEAPCVIFIDEIDALCPARDSVTDEAQKRIVATLLTLMDGIEGAERVVILAATNRPHALDAAMRRPGRLDREIEIGIPTREGRLDILLRALKKHIVDFDNPVCTQGDAEEKHNPESSSRTTSSPASSSFVDVDTNDRALTRADVAEVASLAHGYVGADLLLVVREAALASVHRVYTNQLLHQQQQQQQHQQQQQQHQQQQQLLHFDEEAGKAPNRNTHRESLLTRGDLFAGLAAVRPSAMREVAVDVPEVRWSDIGGQQSVKDRLKEAFEWPLEDPEIFSRLGVPPPKGILLYGPPGCSKTLLAKALATESSRNFIAVKGPELFSKWVGDSEKAVREVFRKARAAAPSIIFFDEIDSIAVARGSGGGESVADRVLTQLLVELDGVETLKDVTVLAATNRPDIIDKALLRPGRIDRILYVSPPDAESAAEIFRIECRRMKVEATVLAEENVAKIGQLAGDKGLSGAEIAACCREAALKAMHENLNAQEVQLAHFVSAFEEVKPRITKAMLDFFKKYQEESGLSSA